jgi:uncharacterized protein (TIGR02118 family)
MRLRRGLLIVYSWLTNYRFRTLLSKNLKPYYPDLKIDVIRTKAGASLTSVSAFLGFVVAVITWLATQEFNTLSELLKTEEARHYVIWYTTLAFVLPYSGFWLERYISAVSVETTDRAERKKRRRVRSSLLILSLAASVFLFLGVPELWPSPVFKPAFSLAGLIMTAFSVVFLVFALEFYDSAAGWRGKEGLHFHLASIASNSYLFGVSLALMGASLCACVSNYYRTGRVLAASALVVLVIMTEIERALWDLENSDLHHVLVCVPTSAHGGTMSDIKVIVIYPQPKDVNAFENAYNKEHIPMAVEKLKGKTKAVLTKVIGSPQGTAPFYRIAEIHFPSRQALEDCLASKGAQETVAHAISISSGGPPIFLFAEEETFHFDAAASGA